MKLAAIAERRFWLLLCSLLFLVSASGGPHPIGHANIEGISCSECNQVDPEVTLRTLDSGRTLRVISQKVSDEEKGRVLILRYVSGGRLSGAEFEQEAQEVWQTIRKDAEELDVQSVDFWPEDFRSGSSMAFWFRRQPDGTWSNGIPSHCCCAPQTPTTLFEAAMWGTAADILSLIHSGSDVNASDQGATPLMLAVARSNRTAVRALIDSGADVNASVDKSEHFFPGYSCLMFAVWKGDAEGVEMLIRAGVDLEKRSADGTTALGSAAIRGHEGILRSLIAAGARVDAASNNGVTPLMVGSGYGSGRAVCVLLAAGADVHRKDAEGKTALLHAVSGRRLWQENAERSADCFLGTIRALLAAGADPNSQDPKGNTALALATAAQDSELIHLLTSQRERNRN